MWKPLSEGDILSGSSPYRNDFYAKFGSRYGYTYDGMGGDLQRLAPVLYTHSMFGEMGNEAIVKTSSVDANGIQTITATITTGWMIRDAESGDKDMFLAMINAEKDRLIGCVDGHLGRITSVESIRANAMGSTNTFKVTLDVTTVSKV